ncbi:MAG: hypothetical protein KDD66_13855 [Bdellovibrionales bacterium]|nr:hypothetical protein [Bdellovibrionales bacterium]
MSRFSHFGPELVTALLAALAYSFWVDEVSTVSDVLGGLAFAVHCSSFPAHIRQILLLERAKSPGANSELRSWLISTSNGVYLLWAISAGDDTIALARATGLVFAYMILAQLVRFGSSRAKRIKACVLAAAVTALILSPHFTSLLVPLTSALGVAAVALNWFALVFGNLHQIAKLRRAEPSQRQLVSWQQKAVVTLRHVVWIAYAASLGFKDGWTPLLIHVVGAGVYGWTLWELRPRRS